MPFPQLDKHNGFFLLKQLGILKYSVFVAKKFYSLSGEKSDSFHSTGIFIHNFSTVSKQ